VTCSHTVCPGRNAACRAVGDSIVAGFYTERPRRRRARSVARITAALLLALQCSVAAAARVNSVQEARTLWRRFSGRCVHHIFMLKGQRHPDSWRPTCSITPGSICVFMTTATTSRTISRAFRTPAKQESGRRERWCR
jgi:hypothetical protein